MSVSDWPRLSTYVQLTARATDGGPPPDAFAREDQLVAHGFPLRVAQAFVATADVLDAVLLTRVPGPAATQLIDDGHDLKSFYIHAKSCNWGPMAGFVCELPVLNKKGPGNMGFNLEENLKTRTWFDVLLGRELEAAHESGNPTDNVEAVRARAGLARTPFVPLSISELAWATALSLQGIELERVADPSRIIGVASNKDRNVLLEFVLVQQPAEPVGTPERLALYHRQIWFRDDADQSMLPYLSLVENPPDQRLQFAQPHGEAGHLNLSTDGAIELSDDEVAAFVRAKAALGGSELVPGRLPEQRAYPIRGLQNPYPPYSEGDPRNAVTGDYDLFALWPRRGSSRWEETVRFSEGRTPASNAQPLRGLFHPVARRPYTVELAGAPGVYIEVIPSYKEIAGLEHEVLGNINDVVHLAAGILNSSVTSRYGRTRHAVNAAFHSDEGGRPNVNEIDYTVAAFLPRSLRGANGEAVVLLSNHNEFLAILELVSGRCDVPLNFGWLIHLLCDLADSGELRTAEARYLPDSDLYKFFHARIRAQRELSPAGLLALRERVAAFLTGRPQAWEDPGLRTLVEQACSTAIRLAELQGTQGTTAQTMTAVLLGNQPG